MIHIARKPNHQNYPVLSRSMALRTHTPRINDNPIVYTVVKQSDGSWLYTWTAGSPEYRIYLDGVLIDTTSAQEYEFYGAGYDNTPPPIEITSSGITAETELYRAVAVLQWRYVDGAFEYWVQKYTGGAWVQQSRIPEIGAGYYKFVTPIQDDCTETSWRVLAVDENGIEGDAVIFTFTLARNPDEPDITMSYDSGTLTIAGA